MSDLLESCRKPKGAESKESWLNVKSKILGIGSVVLIAATSACSGASIDYSGLDNGYVSILIKTNYGTDNEKILNEIKKYIINDVQYNGSSFIDSSIKIGFLCENNSLCYYRRQLRIDITDSILGVVSSRSNKCINIVVRASRSYEEVSVTWQPSQSGACYA